MKTPEPASENRRRLLPPLGALTLAAFVICAVSGAALALVYRPGTALDSIALLLLKNPWGSYLRGLHDWSAQLFLVLTILHVLDYLQKKGETLVTPGMWARLTLTLPAVLFAMVSGFMLRGDPAAGQAARILTGLLETIPGVGRILAAALVGSGKNLDVVYINHVCAATIFIWLTTIDHGRRIVPDTRSLGWVLPPLAVVAVFLVPSLGPFNTAVEKGPWYLVGLQEILHWTAHPGLVVAGATALLALFAALPFLPERPRLLAKQSLFVLLAAYSACTVVGLYFRGDSWRFGYAPPAASYLPVASLTSPDPALLHTVVPIVAGRREGCLACHADMSGFSPAHDPKALGCASCHGGNPFSLVKVLAHAGMTSVPGNLARIDQTCASAGCHADIAPRIHTSLMNTLHGVIAVDRQVFGEKPGSGCPATVAQLGHSPADTHLRQLCASCHLGNPKLEPGPIGESSRGGGCSACHLNYDAAALADLHRPRNASTGNALPTHHPGISLQIPATACFGCHSRSGRISTNYEGWHETLLTAKAAAAEPGWPGSFRVLADGRVFEKQPDDVHHAKGMACIDCHLASEIMGDGNAHPRAADAIKVSCLDCHDNRPPASIPFPQLDPETQKIVSLRQLEVPGRRFVVAGEHGPAYPNVFAESGAVVVQSKAAGVLLHPRPLRPVCTRAIAGHERLSCSACHTAWAPQCITCHTSFNRGQEAWDHLDRRWTKGAWEEQSGDFRAELPTLGVTTSTTPAGKTTRAIRTFIPGMIMTLKAGMTDGGAQPGRFIRRFAPTSAHTTSAQGRSCESCHDEPLAIGYGRGRLLYRTAGGRGIWTFQPALPASPRDGLPLDAWIGFLQEPKPASTDSPDNRPFNLAEQHRILLVGACLQCHEAREPRLAAVFADFANYRTKISPRCLLPDWRD